MNVIITGAAGGLGRAMAVECARRGWRLFLTDVSEGGLQALRLGLERQYDATVTAKTCDLTDSAQVDGLMALLDRCGLRFDLLLNVAGVDFEGGFQSREREKIVKIVSINNAATLRITHAVLERRRTERPFYAVFVSSLASMFPMPLKATYAASKRFLLDFALALRQELRGEEANVLALCPGGMVTNAAVTAAIDAQGFFGSITTNPLEKVARKTIDRVLEGRARYIPGGFNRFLSVLGKLVPPGLVAAAVHWRWRSAQKKWLNG